MARLKSKTEEIMGNLDPKHWVEKSDPLVLMRSVPFSLGELKILDTYISRINAADDTRRTVIFTKEEYEELMGLSCANPRALQKHIKALLSRVPELYMPDDGYISFVLFEKAYYHKDEYGKPIIELTCTETSKNLFFCIGKYHYFKYALENVIHLTRKVSYLLYLHILTNRYRGEWEVTLDELRDEVLNCKGQESYQEYKIFKNRVLDPAVKEVNEKTDCHFSYEPIRRSRKVAKIKFIYHPKAQIDGQFTFDEPPTAPLLAGQDEDKEEYTPVNDRLEFLSEACKNEFTPAQMEQLLEIIISIPTWKLPPDNAAGGSLELRRYHYLAERYAAMNRYAPNKNRFNYLVKMLKDDTKAD